MKQRSCGAHSAGMTNFTTSNVQSRSQRRKGAHVSEQEQRDELEADEEIEDLEVSDEQTDDVTGGAKRGRGFNPDARK